MVESVTRVHHVSDREHGLDNFGLKKTYTKITS